MKAKNPLLLITLVVAFLSGCTSITGQIVGEMAGAAGIEHAAAKKTNADASHYTLARDTNADAFKNALEDAASDLGFQVNNVNYLPKGSGVLIQASLLKKSLLGGTTVQVQLMADKRTVTINAHSSGLGAEKTSDVIGQFQKALSEKLT